MAAKEGLFSDNSLLPIRNFVQCNSSSETVVITIALLTPDKVKVYQHHFASIIPNVFLRWSLWILPFFNESVAAKQMKEYDKIIYRLSNVFIASLKRLHNKKRGSDYSAVD